jgi:hypothetical protein
MVNPECQVTKNFELLLTANSEPTKSIPDPAASVLAADSSKRLIQQHAVVLGPSLPPAEERFTFGDRSGEGPSSPYSANRAVLRDLTLPPVPNVDIPPSPPGSPPPATTKRFEKFLELKKKGTHFNSKLAMSSALKNPSLTDKLMDFVELDEQSQFSTTLSPELWDPAGFPEWAFRGPLKKSQDATRKEREAEKAGGSRSAVEFEPASIPDLRQSVNLASRASISSGAKRKAGAL